MIRYVAFVGSNPTDVFYDSASHNSVLALHKAVVKQAVNSAFTFDFSITEDNPYYSQFTLDNRSPALVTVSRYIDSVLDETLFCGYVSRVKTGTDNIRQVECDGLLAVASNLVWHPFSWPGGASYDPTAENFLRQQIVSTMLTALYRAPDANAYRYFQVGTVTAESAGDFFSISYDKPTDCMTMISDLLEHAGGYIIPRYNSNGYGTMSIDWLGSPTEQSTQGIRYGSNLISIETEDDNSESVNAIFPVGSGEGNEKVFLPYVSPSESQADGTVRRGCAIYKALTNPMDTRMSIREYEGVSTQSGLLTAAKSDLAREESIKRVTSVSAADLSSITGDEPFKLFQSVTVESSPHESQHHFSDSYIITELAIDILDPAESTVTVGTQAKSLTGGSKSSSGSGTIKKLYYVTGDRLNEWTIHTSGYVTDNSSSVRFNIPLSKPVISDSVTVSMNMWLRQNNKYTHGSSANTSVIPSSITAKVTPFGIRIDATMSSTTNAINNSPIGIMATVSITIN